MARKATGNTDQGISAAVQNPTRYTISVWFRPTNAPSISTYSNVVGYGDSTCEGGVAWDHQNSAFRGGAWYHQNLSAGYPVAKYATTLNAGTLYHLCGVYDGSNILAYLNGVQDASAVAGDPQQSVNSKWTIGNTNFASHVAAFGEISHVAIYNVALTAAEVAALAKGVSPLRIRRGSLIRYWPVYGRSSPEPDYSGNGDNLTLTGFATLADNAPVGAPFGADEWVQYAVSSVASGSAAFTSTAVLGPVIAAVQASAAFTSAAVLGPAVAAVQQSAAFTSTAQLGPAVAAVQASAAFTSTATLGPAVAATAQSAAFTSTATLGPVVAATQQSAAFTSTGHLGTVAVAVTNSAAFTSVANLVATGGNPPEDVIARGLASEPTLAIGTAAFTSTAAFTLAWQTAAAVAFSSTATLVPIGGTAGDDRIARGLASDATIIEAIFTSTGQLGPVTAAVQAAAAFTSQAALVPVSRVAVAVAFTSTAQLGPISVAGPIAVAFTSTAQLGPVGVAVPVAVAFTSTAQLGPVAATAPIAVAFNSNATLAVAGAIGVAAAFTSTASIAITAGLPASAAVFTSRAALVPVSGPVGAPTAFTSTATLGPVVGQVAAAVSFSSNATLAATGVIAVVAGVAFTSNAHIAATTLLVLVPSTAFTSTGRLVANVLLLIQAQVVFTSRASMAISALEKIPQRRYVFENHYAASSDPLAERTYRRDSPAPVERHYRRS
jgi:hypothetical protein